MTWQRTDIEEEMRHRPDAPEILPDLLQPGLRLVICGTAVGNRTAETGLYYSGNGNRFWSILHETALTQERLTPSQYDNLMNYGIGLSDLCKVRAGGDRTLNHDDFNVDDFDQKVARFKPMWLAFNGKKAAAIYFNIRRTKYINYGQLRVEDAERIPGDVEYRRRKFSQVLGATKVYVLPSTSGSGAGFWDAWYWHDLAARTSEQA